MVSIEDMNKIDGVGANLLERMRRSLELRDAGLMRSNDRPIRLILKKPTQSPIKEGRKVLMNLSTTVWEVETDYASPTHGVDENGVQFVLTRDTGCATNESVNVPVQVAKENVKALNDGESGVGKNPNTSPNTNDYATDFVKDVMANVQTACANANRDEPNAKDTVVDHDVDAKVKTTSEKVNISFASALKHKVIRVAHIAELRNDERVEGVAVTLLLVAIEEVSLRFANTLYGYFVGKRLAYQLVENYVKNVWSKYGLKRIQLQGRSAYARALIEVSADDVLKDDLVIAIPFGKDKEVTSAVVIDVDTNHSKDMADEGFKVVKKKQNKKKKHQKQVGKSTSTSALNKIVWLENSFSALNDDEESEWNDNTTWKHTQQVLNVLNESDSDVDEEITLDDRGGNLKTT
uniref:Zinc knuckle CX2CX4HX4C n=1 Tax=Tanacetum cinerariifolium TaxID=118510 RepID=A0A6L2LZS1_TANCI|nr:zinc knuckle CX2CX4HX4C [Tanacetum cinerariifolium]